MKKLIIVLLIVGFAAIAIYGLKNDKGKEETKKYFDKTQDILIEETNYFEDESFELDIPNESKNVENTTSLEEINNDNEYKTESTENVSVIEEIVLEDYEPIELPDLE